MPGKKRPKGSNPNSALARVIAHNKADKRLSNPKPKPRKRRGY